MKKKYVLLILVLLLIPAAILAIILLKPGEKKPVTLTLWHNYGGQMKDTMDEMIEEFNGTVGAKEGVFISVTSISGSSTLHDKLTMAANGDPGAPSLPDITTAYPKTALILAEKGLLVNLEEQFSDEELAKYIPRFIEEGRLNGDDLYVFPTAKSTEVLFVNTTIFDRFAADTGVTLEDLKTFEGIMNTSKLYYEWTDKQTPDIPNDGKTFYVPDSVFNLSYIGCKQLGSEFIQNNAINFTNPDTKTVWETFMTPATQGQFAIFEGYASDLAKTGDIVCSTGSTAGVAFFPPTVTYPDNTTEDAKLTILPYPTFEGGEKIAIQRGAGMCVIKSNPEKERMAGIFLKWFTSPENNLHFVASTGYLPVTEEAFGDIMLKEMDNISDENIQNLLQVSREMQAQYDFCISPLFDGVDLLQSNYETNIKAMATDSKEQYLSLLQSETAEDALGNTLDGKYEEFMKEFE
ncbi:MAG TPA: extracellular solute-binding protein [Mobilitalea sp.]|nr:extracellular solute-binding protein [Mobilitalea sp.]